MGLMGPLGWPAAAQVARCSVLVQLELPARPCRPCQALWLLPTCLVFVSSASGDRPPAQLGRPGLAAPPPTPPAAPPHLLSDSPLQGSRGRRSTFDTSMLRCQALSVGRPGAGIAARPLRSAAARPQPCLVVAAAPPDGGSGQPPSSRRPASRLEPLPAAEQLGSSPRLGSAAPHSSGHHGAHGAGAAAAAHPKASQAPVEPGSWEDWQRYFYEMDDVVNELESLYSEQEEAVAREDYRAAAALKAQREVRQGYRGLWWLSS